MQHEQINIEQDIQESDDAIVGMCIKSDQREKTRAGDGDDSRRRPPSRPA
jgi:hypothetical protein